MESAVKKGTNNILDQDESSLMSFEENVKFPSFDETRLDNCLDKTDFKAYKEEVLLLTSYLRQFNNSIKGILDFDVVVNRALLEFKFSREKILVYTFFTERIVCLTYHFVLLQNSEVSSPKEIEEMSIFPGIKLSIVDLSEEEMKSESQKIYDELLKNKVIEITNEDSEIILARILDLLIFEQKIIKKASDKSHKTSTAGMIVCLKYLHVVLDDISNIFKLFRVSEVNNNATKKVSYHDEALNLFNFYWRLKHVQVFFGEAFFVDHTDLFNQSINSEEWKPLLKNIVTVFLFSQTAMRTKVQKLVDMVILGSAFISKSLQIEEGALRTLGTGIYMTLYFFDKDKANKQAKIFNTSPSLEAAKCVWNLMDTKMIRQGLKIAITSIDFRRKFYFRRTKKPITYEYLQELSLKLTDKQALNDYINQQSTSDDLIKDLDQDKLLVSSLEDSEKSGYVKIKLLHTSTISTEWENKHPGLFSCCSNRANHTRDALIIHIHGGGFVAMSSTSHENYLRKWCKSLNAPIISIDYRLAPENPYPSALDDVYQAYCFILKYASTQLMIELNKIILVGDSAGGSLSLGLINILIAKGIRLPDAVFSIYPCVRLDSFFFSPSKLIALKDQVLSMNFMLICKDAYFGENEVPNSDFFANPINTPDHVSKIFKY